MSRDDALLTTSETYSRVCLDYAFQAIDLRAAGMTPSLRELTRVSVLHGSAMFHLQITEGVNHK